MSCTIEKILTDAKTLLERLREHDAAAESLVDQSAALHRRVAAMREAGTALPDQYQEDASDLKDMSKYKPHILLSQENTQIRDLQQENRELWVSLEEHQDALELIMSKYRKQMLQLMVVKKAVDAEPVLKAHQTHSAEIESQIDRICEMGEVMRKAVQVDDDQFCKIQEKLAQLEVRLLLFSVHTISPTLAGLYLNYGSFFFFLMVLVCDVFQIYIHFSASLRLNLPFSSQRNHFS
ncbi:suppressor of IKBKE 1 isoform X1 [Pipistrellus kuhlii]|uniref:suppressor of IKBKE 1 isoform X1 n=1 Tax=Pipistrellus kuhlii TaxID=59472 RepID=UPI00174EF3EA|nr:suppressor of IKBKE 1 isoform X1 [Pipistrellus kuhlii]